MKKFLSIIISVLLLVICSTNIFASEIVFSLNHASTGDTYIRGEKYTVSVNLDDYSNKFAVGSLYFTLGEGLEYIESGFFDGSKLSGEFTKTVAGNNKGSYAFPILSLNDIKLSTGPLCYITFKVTDNAPNKTFIKFFGYDLVNSNFSAVQTNTSSIILTIENKHGDIDGSNDTDTQPSVVPSQNQTDSVSFSDVTSSHWAHDYIIDLAEKHIVSGVGNGKFAPDRFVTRAEFVKMISGIVGINVEGYVISSFTDVKEDDWFMPYIGWAVDNGITTGTSSTTFSPNTPVTREQAATFLYRLLDKYGISLQKVNTLSYFADSDEISSYAMDAVYYMQQAGIINGVGSNRFNPKGTTTRAATCKMISLILSK